MTLGLVFWILMLLWLVFSLWWSWPFQPNSSHANNAFLFLMFLIIGWAVFGAPIR